MSIFGYVTLSMAGYGCPVQCPWLAIAVYGWLWLSMSMAVYGWLSLAILPRLWLAMAVYIWLFYLVYGWLWLSISGYFTSSLAVYGWLGSRDYVTTITVRVKITTNTYVYATTMTTFAYVITMTTFAYATTMTTFAYVITRFAQCIWIWNWFCFDGLAYKRFDPIRPAVTIYTIQYIRPKYVNFSMLRCCCIWSKHVYNWLFYFVYVTTTDLLLCLCHSHASKWIYYFCPWHNHAYNLNTTSLTEYVTLSVSQPCP